MKAKKTVARTRRLKRAREIVEPRLAKPLLALHAATDVEQFWSAAQDLLEAAMPLYFIGHWLQLNPTLPMIYQRNRLPTPGKESFEDYFKCHPLIPYLAAHPGVRFVRTSDVFSPEHEILRAAFYRRYMKPEKWRYSVAMVFWRRGQALACLAPCRTAAQGDFNPTEMRLLRQLYSHFQVALRRLHQAERERTIRAALEKFLRRIPLPTVLLNWSLKPVYDNRAAREACAVWMHGSKAARLLKAETLILPSEVLQGCERLKTEWLSRPGSNGSSSVTPSVMIRHPHDGQLHATIELEQLNSTAMARPHILIHFQVRPPSALRSTPDAACRSHFAGLTRRERELVSLVCTGDSNQEIAHQLSLSIETVKKKLHAIFRKLQVPSRGRLMALCAGLPAC